MSAVCGDCGELLSECICECALCGELLDQCTCDDNIDDDASDDEDEE